MLPKVDMHVIGPPKGELHRPILHQRARLWAMIPARRKLFLEVVDHEEFVEVEKSVDAQGNVQHEVVEGSRTAFLHLQVPGGTRMRVPIPYEELDPILAKMIPDFYGPTEP